MPPLPPRRTMRQMLAPRDVTETAQQGRGVGDLASIRQMLGAVGREAASLAPGTGEAMSAADMVQSLRKGEMGSAALSALGAIPFAGTVGRAGARSARMVAEEIAGEAARVARGKKLWPIRVWHSTKSAEPIEEFARMQPRTGQLHDLPGVHVGTEQAAIDRMNQVWGIDDWTSKEAKKILADEAREAKRMNVPAERPSILPLRMRMEKPYLKQTDKGVRPFTERELQEQVRNYLLGAPSPTPDDYWNNIRRAREAMANDLKAQGYDVIPYINRHEDPGSISYLVLEPNRLRSIFAKFDPKNIGSANLSAGIAGLLTGGAALQASRTGQEDQP